MTNRYHIIDADSTDRISDPTALGVYVYLSTRPEGWILRRSDVMRRFNLSRHRFDKALRHLKQEGLVASVTTHDAEGRITGHSYRVQGIPAADKTDQRAPKSPEIVQKLTQRPNLSTADKTDQLVITNKTLIINDKEPRETPKPETPKPEAAEPAQQDLIDPAPAPRRRRKKPKVPMTDDWGPSAKTIISLMQKNGIPEDFLEQKLDGFKAYWIERGDHRPGWEATYMNAMQAIWKWEQQNHATHQERLEALQRKNQQERSQAADDAVFAQHGFDITTTF